MIDLADRLVGCFTSVFPDLSAEAARNATARSIKAWDSIATVMLITVIEEEFDTKINVDDIPALSSFRSITLYLESTLQRQRPNNDPSQAALPG